MLEPKIDLAEEMQRRYKNVFGTAEGKIVLGDILTMGHFGETLNPTDAVAMTENTFAIVIARMAGAFDQLWQELGMIKGE